MAQQPEDTIARGVARLRSRGIVLTLTGKKVEIGPDERVNIDMDGWVIVHNAEIREYLEHEPPAPAPAEVPALAAVPTFTRPSLGKRKPTQRSLLAVVQQEQVAEKHETASFAKIPNYVHEALFERQVSAHAHMLLSLLLLRKYTFNGHHEAPIAQRDLLRDLHWSFSSLGAATVELEALGLLQVERSASRKRGKGVNVYTLNWAGLKPENEGSSRGGDVDYSSDLEI
jgi:hypothetical protein